MSIISKLQERSTGITTYGTLPKPMLTEDISIKPLENNLADEYVLSISLQVTFIANKAQYSDALKEAKKRLSIIMYNDYLEKLIMVKDAIRAGDALQSHSLLDEIIADMESY